MALVELPAMHAGQYRLHTNPARWKVIQCGRRWGKTTFGQVEACVAALRGKHVGWFAPNYKFLAEPWRQIGHWMAPISTRIDKNERRQEYRTGGLIDFWTTDGGDPGRSRAYDLAIIDEAGLVRGLMDVFYSAIRPTLTDRRGSGLFLGTPKGRREFTMLYEKGQQGEEGWYSVRGKTIDNPSIDPAEVESARRMLPLAIFLQEFEGIPADDGGNPFGIEAIAKCFGGVDRTSPVMVWGVDLAKSQDWTVAVGLSAAGHAVQVHRWQGTPWSVTIDRLVGIIGNTPALVDSTGIGDAIVEQLQAKMPSVEGYTFTARSKQQLMEGLSVAVQTQAMRFDDPVTRSEMETFGYEYTATGVRYEAPSGLHDDCVCALALAVEHLGRYGGKAGVSMVGYGRAQTPPDLPNIYTVDHSRLAADRARRFMLEGT